MPYLTTTAASSSAVFSLLDAWITGSGTTQLGWGAYDNISTWDHVYYTSGSASSNRPNPLYIRMTLSLKEPGGPVAGAHAWDNVTLRAYRSWNKTTHTGSGEAGAMGPRVWFPNTSTGDNCGYFLPAVGVTTLFGETSPNTTVGITVENSYGNCNEWDGKRFWHLYSVSLRAFVLAESAQAGYLLNGSPSYDLAVGPSPSTGIANQDTVGLYTVDAVNGRDYLWFLTDETVGGEVFYQYDPLTNVYTTKANTPWYNLITPYNQQLCWDGGNTSGAPGLIYALAGANTASFASYNISTNVWTSLPSCPHCGSWSTSQTTQGLPHMVYMTSGTLNSSSDAIFVIPPTTNNNQSWYKYNVQQQTWTALMSGTFGTALPFAQPTTPYYQGFTALGIGTAGRIYYAAQSGSSQVLYHYEIGSGSGNPNAGVWAQDSGFSINGTDWASGGTSRQELRVLDGQCGKLVCPTAVTTITIQAQGNGDFFSVILSWVPGGSPTTSNNVYRFAYAGFYNAYNTTTAFTTSNSIYAGSNVIINLQSNPSGTINIGDTVMIFNPNATLNPLSLGLSQTTTGSGEPVVVSAVTTGSITVQTLVNQYASGMLIAGDPMPAGVGNDFGYFCTLYGGNGYWGDGEADVYRMAILTQPKITSIKGPRNNTVGYPVTLYNYQTITGAGKNSSLNEILGELYFTTSAPSGSVAGNVAQDENSLFAVFPLYNGTSSLDTRLWQAGVINQ